MTEKLFFKFISLFVSRRVADSNGISGDFCERSSWKTTIAAFWFSRKQFDLMRFRDIFELTVVQNQTKL